MTQQVPALTRSQCKTRRLFRIPGSSKFKTGSERVFHQKFGYGAVEQIDDDKLTVAFEKAGVKKVVAAYVAKADAVPF